MTPEEIEESERVSLLFHAALVQLGAQSMSDSLALWGAVPPVPAVVGTRAVQEWLTTAVRYVMRRRLRARDLALAYYRYQRALATGKTIALPGQEVPPSIPLFELKQEFESFLTVETPGVSEDREITVEELDGLAEEFISLEEEANEQVTENLLVLGPINQDSKVNKASGSEIEQVDEQRAEAHNNAGRRQASSTARHVMNGARGSLFLAADRDREAIGFIRVSRTGTPCGFCAMLISRGPVLKSRGRQASLYKSNEGTGPKADGTIVTYGDLDLYHDNCQCYAVPIFSIEQFREGEMFALNREYAELWPEVTEGLGGKDALTEWRRFIREQQAEAQAQAAAA